MQAVSTATTATSPGDTFASPPACAKIFSVIVMPMEFVPGIGRHCVPSWCCVQRPLGFVAHSRTDSRT